MQQRDERGGQRNAAGGSGRVAYVSEAIHASFAADFAEPRLEPPPTTLAIGERAIAERHAHDRRVQAILAAKGFE